MGKERNFFFFSGEHDKDFPWGDDGIFWDVALLIQKADTTWERYVLTDRIIDGLFLDVEKGIYRYEGPLYQLLEGYQVSQSELKKDPLPNHLRRIQANIEIRFDCEKYPVVDVPFSMIPDYHKLVSREHWGDIREWLPHLTGLGLHLTPHKVRVREGRIVLQDSSSREEYSIVADRTLGEAEKVDLQEHPLAETLLQLFLRPGPGLGRDLRENSLRCAPGKSERCRHR